MQDDAINQFLIEVTGDFWEFDFSTEKFVKLYTLPGDFLDQSHDFTELIFDPNNSKLIVGNRAFFDNRIGEINFVRQWNQLLPKKIESNGQLIEWNTENHQNCATILFHNTGCLAHAQYTGVHKILENSFHITADKHLRLIAGIHWSSSGKIPFLRRANETIDLSYVESDRE